MRLPTKPSQLPTSDRQLAGRAAERHRRWRARRAPSRAPRTTSSSRITLAGEKKCRPITSCGRDVAAAISSMSGARCWWRGSAPGLHTASSFANTCFLTAMSSNTASTTRSAFGQVVVGERAGDERQRAGPCRPATAAPWPRWPPSSWPSSRGPGRVRPATPRACITGRPALAKLIAMPPPIVPAPMHRDPADRAQRRVLGQVRDACGLALGEEHVAQRLRLRAGDQHLEALPLEVQPLLERQPGRRLDAGQALERRLEPALAPADALARRGEEGVGVVDARRALGDHRVRTAGRGHPPRERDRPGAQVALDDLVDQPDRAGPRRVDLFALDDHVQRRLHADQPRQPLRAAAAGQQPAPDLGQAQLRAGRRRAGSDRPAPSPGRRPARCRGSPRRSAWPSAPSAGAGPACWAAARRPAC